MIVQGDVLAEFLHERINLPKSSDTVYIGLQRRDLSIAGVVAYNGWQEDSVFMHVCFGTHAVSRAMLREAFMYPFIACGKSRVYGMTPITSKRALAFSKKVGFREIVRTPDFLLQVMSREECRWIHDSTSSDRAYPSTPSGAAAGSSACAAACAPI